MSENGNAYYPKAIVADFSSVKSIAEVSALGLIVVNGRIGGINKDDKITSCRSDPANVRFTSDGAVQLVVPGKPFVTLAWVIWADSLICQPFTHRRTENGRGCHRCPDPER